MEIHESLKTPVKYTPDVLVAGGGIGGIAAALAARRQGASVLLVERGFMLGGLATAGLVTVYLPLCDGYGRQVSFGIAEELLRLSVARFTVPDRPADNWLKSDDPALRTEKHPRFEVDFNPQIFAIDAEKALLDEGIDILYGTVAVDAYTEDGKITSVILENKSGRIAVCPKSVVDATGDADIAYRAGAPTETFKQGNVVAYWCYTASANEPGYRRRMLGYADIPDEKKAKGQKGAVATDAERFTGLGGEEITRFMFRSHEATVAAYERFRGVDPTCEIATLASIPQLRMTRRIVGAYTQASDEMHREYADTVGMVSDWRERGPVYEVPFSTLYSPAMKNLIIAGRCTSVTDGLWDVMRVIPCCAVTGEAAGIAAAMTDDFTSIDISELQARLTANGVVLHEKDL